VKQFFSMRLFIAILFASFFSCFQNLFAQAYLNRDSLWQVFSTSKPDTNRVLVYIQLGQQYENNNPDSALLLYEAALKLSTELDYTRGIIKYYQNATYVYNNFKGKYDTSLLLNLKSVEIARAFGDPKLLAACLGNVGASYLMLEQYEKGVASYLEIIPLYEKLNSKSQLIVIYENLCTLYWNLMQYQKAIEYGELSVQLGREVNDVNAITASLVNLANAYNANGQFDKSIELLKEAQRLARQTNNQYALMNSALNIGNAYLTLGEFKNLKRYYDEAMLLAEKLGNVEGIIIAQRGLAIYFYTQGDLSTSEKYALRSLKSAQENSMTLNIAKDYTVLAEIALLKKDFKANNFYSLKSDSIRNALLNESVVKNIQNIEAKYQSEKKAQQIKDLQQEGEIKNLSIKQSRLWVFILIGSLVVVLAIAILTRKTFLQKKKILEKENALSQSRITKLEKEKQLQASEAVIKGQDEERGRIAKDLHDGLGGLLSGVKFSLTNMKSNVILDSESALVFERSLDMLDHSIGELRRVAHNMMPEVLVKFGLSEALKSYCESLRESKIYKIDFQAIGLEGRLASNTEIFIYRIVQELLNNISKHAQASQVLVQLAQQANELSITVEDNGIGMTEVKNFTSTGAGWTNIRSRVEYLKGKLDIQATKDQGTSVHIIVPLL
jgi:two-component system, NarL family, sensor kinase